MMKHGWINPSLDSLAEVAAGQAAPQGEHNFGRTGYPFVRAGSLDFLTKGGNESELEQIEESIATSHGLRLFPADTVLFAKSGMSATKGLIYRLRQPCYVVSHLAAIVPGESLAPEYLTRWLETYPPIALISNSAYPSIRLSQVAAVNIHLPKDTAEQRRIAAILDKADAIRRKRRETIRLLDDFLRSVFLDMFGDPMLNPKEWPMGTIGDLAASTQYGTSKKAAGVGALPYVRMGNITYEGGWDFSDMKFIDLTKAEQSRYLVRKGEVLFNRTNSRDLVGKTAVFREPKPMAYAGYLVKLVANEMGNGEYIAAAMNSNSIKAYLRAKCKNIIGMANINAQEFRAVPLPIPPIELQKKFAKIVGSTLKSYRQMELAITWGQVTALNSNYVFHARFIAG